MTPTSHLSEQDKAQGNEAVENAGGPGSDSWSTVRPHALWCCQGPLSFRTCHAARSSNRGNNKVTKSAPPRRGKVPKRYQERISWGLDEEMRVMGWSEVVAQPSWHSRAVSTSRRTSMPSSDSGHQRTNKAGNMSQYIAKTQVIQWQAC